MDTRDFRSHDFKVEALVDEFVLSIGGELVRNIVGPSPPFDNADYLLRKVPAVIELKTLQEDYLANGGWMNRFHRALENASGIERIEHPGQYLIPNTPKLWSNLRGVPQEPLRRILKKANRQLRDTAEHFSMPQALKIVLVNNDGLLSMSPDDAVENLGSILDREFSNIHGCVYFTSNIYARREDGTRVQVWMPFCLERHEDVLVPFLTRLGQQWVESFEPKISKLWLP